MADYTPRMKAKYEAEIVKAMTEKFGYTNRLEVPRLEKITLNGVWQRDGTYEIGGIKSQRAILLRQCAS
jgi:ribosomal protein L5